MEFLDILRYAPLIAAAAWYLLAIIQVSRDRFHTWTEVFFLATCFFAGTYAYGDWLLFTQAPGPGYAYVAAVVGTSSLVLAELFFLLFSLVYIDRMRQVYWVFAIISGAVVALTSTMLIVGVTRPGGIFIPQFREGPLLVYLVYVLGYGIAGIWGLYRLYRIVKRQDKALALRAAGLLVTFTLILVLGLATNGYLGLSGNQENIPPPFSTLLIFVAANAYYTLFPGGRGRISEAIRSFQSRLYRVQGAFLIYKDGTLIGAEITPGEIIIDKDLFSATLDVIQNFMTTSFPAIHGFLHSIQHGDSTLVLERGRWAYMVIMLRGESTDQLRRLMRDTLLQFEAENQEALAHWRGVPSDAKGTNELLLSLLGGE